MMIKRQAQRYLKAYFVRPVIPVIIKLGFSRFTLSPQFSKFRPLEVLVSSTSVEWSILCFIVYFLYSLKALSEAKNLIKEIKNTPFYARNENEP